MGQMLKFNILTPKGTFSCVYFEPLCIIIGQGVWSLRVPQKEQEAQLMLTTGATGLAVSRGQQT